jgi:hypothetical protein
MVLDLLIHVLREPSARSVVQLAVRHWRLGVFVRLWRRCGATAECAIDGSAGMG